MRTLSLILIIVLLLAIIMLVWGNSELITLNYVLGQHTLPLSVLLLIVLLLGIVLGLLLSLMLVIRDKRTENNSKKTAITASK